MSLGSKIVFGSSVVFSVSIIYYVHTKQSHDRERMREGVVRDMQRQQTNKIQNIKLLQDQLELTKSMKKRESEEMERHKLKQTVG